MLLTIEDGGEGISSVVTKRNISMYEECGTFDVLLLTIEDGIFEEEATAG